MHRIITFFCLLCFCGTSSAAEKPIRILFIAGQPSHAAGIHEFNAGCELLAQDLEQYVSEKTFGNSTAKMPKITAAVHRNAKPGDTFALEDADVIVVYSDGGGRYPLQGLEDRLEKLRRSGKGFVFLHYALCGSQGNDTVKPPALPPSAAFILNATGGVYEIFYSVNPVYRAEFKSLPEHPITRGVLPFAMKDEFYFNMRFLNNMSTEEIIAQPPGTQNRQRALQAILVATPPDTVRRGPDGAHSGNPMVRNRCGKAEILAWSFQREDGGRGFGCTGGDRHSNWANPSFRKLILNAIVWCAGADIPAAGLTTPPRDN
ncbi:MAG: ThuA domain-containing protein [Planctomycetaceae bacterium]|jgi:hypothetical protein|nr:ThuA domain-containing protein [Planctomycetaceae bacterium]